jgi:hypothetical protein
MADLDAHEPAAARVVQQPGDLEAAERELLSDLDLGAPIEVVPACDGGRQHELSRPARAAVDRHGRPPALI